MILPTIIWDLCQTCDPCNARLACNTRAIVKIDIDEQPFIEHSRCNGCLKCIPKCLYSAISIDNDTKAYK